MKYLRITIHDNDFVRSIEIAANAIFSEYNKSYNDITEDSIPLLKESVRDIMGGIEKIKYGIHIDDGWKFDEEHWREIFTPDITIIDEYEIDDWENGEVYYIPLSHSDRYALICR